MTVKIIKLVNGDELLADVINENIDPIIIKNPVRIIVMPNKIDPKTPNIGFAPWAEFSDDKTFTLDKANIIVIMNPIKEFIQQYNSMFGGLVLPTSNLLVPG